MSEFQQVFPSAGDRLQTSASVSTTQDRARRRANGAAEAQREHAAAALVDMAPVLQKLAVAGRLFGEIAEDLAAVHSLLLDVVQIADANKAALMVNAIAGLVAQQGMLADRAATACGADCWKDQEAWNYNDYTLEALRALEAPLQAPGSHAGGVR